MKFEMSGRQFEFDPDPAKLMGDEMLLIEDNLPAGFAERWAAQQLGVRDVLMWAYIAAKRGGEQAPFEEFVKTVAPATFRYIEAKPEPANEESSLGARVRSKRKPVTRTA